MSDFTAFVSGLITMGYAVAGLFFLSFWRRTREVLFAAFAVAFWLLALNQALVTLMHAAEETESRIYLLRLAAFVIIIVAIVIKNTPRGQDGGG